MKIILYLLSFLILSTTVSFGQDESDQGAKIRERMTEYIQKRLSLSKAEAEKFSPVFLNYFNDLRKTTQEYKDGDRLVLQQKVVELKLNYRNQFKTIVGEKKSNDVFIYEREFINEIKELRNERSQNKPGGGGRNKR